MPKKKPQKGKPQVHDELEGFEVEVNEFGQITSNRSPEELNKFLDKNVDDKKLRGLEGEDDDDYVDANEEGKEEEEKEESIDDILTDQEEE